jgi:hypothetical protein
LQRQASGLVLARLPVLQHFVMFAVQVQDELRRRRL